MNMCRLAFTTAGMTHMVRNPVPPPLQAAVGGNLLMGHRRAARAMSVYLFMFPRSLGFYIGRFIGRLIYRKL